MVTFTVIFTTLLMAVAGVFLGSCELSEATKKLLQAAEDDNRGAIREAVTAGADVNARDEDGKTPLIYVIKNGYIDGIWFLVKCGAYAGLPDREGKTPLMYAAETGDLGTAEIFIDVMNLDINNTDSKGWTPLAYAEQMGHDRVARFLAWKGAKLDDIKQRVGQKINQAASRSQ